MPLEWLNTFFLGATFVVIMLTAIAALVQLRHLRTSNQIGTMVALMEIWQGPELQQHYHYLLKEFPKKLADPSFVATFRTDGLSREEHPELLVADFWEQIGTYMKYGYLDEKSWLDIAGAQIPRAWDILEPAIAASQERFGLSAWENFEYAAVRARQWAARYPHGNYPQNVPRMAEWKRGQATVHAREAQEDE